MRQTSWFTNDPNQTFSPESSAILPHQPSIAARFKIRECPSCKIQEALDQVGSKPSLAYLECDIFGLTEFMLAEISSLLFSFMEQPFIYGVHLFSCSLTTLLRIAIRPRILLSMETVHAPTVMRVSQETHAT